MVTRSVKNDEDLAGYEVKIEHVSTMKALGRPQYTYGTALK